MTGVTQPPSVKHRRRLSVRRREGPHSMPHAADFMAACIRAAHLSLEQGEARTGTHSLRFFRRAKRGCAYSGSRVGGSDLDE